MLDVSILSGIGIEMALKHLPKRLIGYLYPTTRIVQKIKIDLRGNNPIQIARFDIPKISLWFEIKNRSLVDLVLDRMLIEIQINSQPILYGAMLRRQEIPKTDDTIVYFNELLTSLQQQHLLSRRDKNKMIETIHVDVEAYFEFNSEIIKINIGSIYTQNVKCEL
ncbi:hypothetical protein M0R72_18745 [Candidatus Pacearchaeota archaeon]|jgi:hypothetical protein|nr:hypothetical protein [Candidatus Pacearchaeota archaeon]